MLQPGNASTQTNLEQYSTTQSYHRPPISNGQNGPLDSLFGCIDQLNAPFDVSSQASDNDRDSQHINLEPGPLSPAPEGLNFDFPNPPYEPENSSSGFWGWASDVEGPNSNFTSSFDTDLGFNPNVNHSNQTIPIPFFDQSEESEQVTSASDRSFFIPSNEVLADFEFPESLRSSNSSSDDFGLDISSPGTMSTQSSSLTFSAPISSSPVAYLEISKASLEQCSKCDLRFGSRAQLK